MLTIDISQFNTYFGLGLPFIIGILASLIRQDGLDTPQYSWINELISQVIIVTLAVVQTLLGGQWGGSGIANFMILVGVSYSLLNTKFGQAFQGKIQTATSVGKPKPPAPQIPTLDQVLAQMTAQDRQTLIQRNMPQPVYNPGATMIPVDQYPTQVNMPVAPPVVMRGNASTNMPTQGG